MVEEVDVSDFLKKEFSEGCEVDALHANEWRPGILVRQVCADERLGHFMVVIVCLFRDFLFPICPRGLNLLQASRTLEHVRKGDGERHGREEAVLQDCFVVRPDVILRMKLLATRTSPNQAP